MSTKSNKAIQEQFANLFIFKSQEQEVQHESKMLMFKFLSEFESLNSNDKLKSKDIAKAIGTSASFVTQLFHGNKLINLVTLAKLQKAFNFTFEVKAIPNNIEKSLDIEDYRATFEPVHKPLVNTRMWIGYKQVDYHNILESQTIESKKEIC